MLEKEDNEEMLLNHNIENNSEEEEPENKRGRHNLDNSHIIQSSDEESNYERQIDSFSVVKKLQESQHKYRMYTVAFSPYDVVDNWSVFCTAIKNVIHIYTSENTSNKMELTRVIHDTNSSEDYFAINWCYDQIEQKSRIIAAGDCGFIKVIDPVSGTLIHEKFGHGDTINELRTNPHNSMVFASVSKDNSARIWHLRKKSALICIGGLKGHLDQVLSCDWSPDSNFLVTCSMDHSIKLWHLNEEAQQLFDTSLYENEDTEDESASDEPKTKETRKQLQPDCPLYLQFPCAETADLHTDYVDCIRFVGWYIISKGTERTAHLFRFGHTGEAFHKVFPYRSDRVTTLIKSFQLPSCDVWFLKFDVSPQYDWAVFGGTDGKLLFFDINAPNILPQPAIEMSIGKRPIRQVCFNSCGNTIITVGDDYTITKILRKEYVANGAKLELRVSIKMSGIIVQTTPVVIFQTISYFYLCHNFISAFRMSTLIIKSFSFIVNCCNSGSKPSSTLNVHYNIGHTEYYASFSMTLAEYNKTLQNCTSLHTRLVDLHF